MPSDNIKRLIALERYLTDYPFGVKILDEIPDACVIIDAETQHIVFTNRYAESLFGYYRSELYDKHFSVLIPIRFREKHEEHTKLYLLEPRRRSMGLSLQTPGLKKDGTEFLAEISLSPIVVPDGFFIIATIRVARDGETSRQTSFESESSIG